MSARMIPGVVESLPAVFVCGECGERFEGRVDPEDGTAMSDTTCPACGGEGAPQGVWDWDEEDEE